MIHLVFRRIEKYPNVSLRGRRSKNRDYPSVLKWLSAHLDFLDGQDRHCLFYMSLILLECLLNEF